MEVEKTNSLIKVIPKTLTASFISILVPSVVIASGEGILGFVTKINSIFELFTFVFKSGKKFKTLATIFPVSEIWQKLLLGGIPSNL